MTSLKLTVLLCLTAAVFCNDLRSGFTDSRQRLFFEQTFDYKPTFYQRKELVNVTTSDNEIISQIEVVDKRELKDGSASIIAGGIGQRTVSIELKSPTIFRGMTFVVKVWASDSAEYIDRGNVNANLQTSDYGNDQQLEERSGFENFNRYTKQNQSVPL